MIQHAPADAPVVGELPEVPHGARLELGHALAQWVAERQGARILHIKGLAAEAVLPLEHSYSADVDILVDPKQHRHYLGALAALDSTEVVDDGGRSSEAHAVEVVSHGLSVSLDVHGRFPGFRADPGDVFEALWARRVSVDFAGRDCACLDRVGLAVLGIVHAARNSETANSRKMAMRRWDLLHEDERAEALGVISTLRASGAASTVIGRFEKASHSDVALFLAHQRGARPVTIWMLTILAAPGLARKAQVLARAATGSARGSVRPAPRPAALPRSRRGLTRVARAARGARAMGPATREAVRLLRESYTDG